MNRFTKLQIEKEISKHFTVQCVCGRIYTANWINKKDGVLRIDIHDDFGFVDCIGLYCLQLFTERITVASKAKPEHNKGGQNMHMPIEPLMAAQPRGSTRKKEVSAFGELYGSEFLAKSFQHSTVEICYSPGWRWIKAALSMLSNAVRSDKKSHRERNLSEASNQKHSRTDGIVHQIKHNNKGRRIAPIRRRNTNHRRV